MNPGAGVKTLKSTPKQNTLNPWVQSSPLTNAWGKADCPRKGKHDMKASKDKADWKWENKRA